MWLGMVFVVLLSEDVSGCNTLGGHERCSASLMCNVCAECNANDRVGCAEGLVCGVDNCGKFHELDSVVGMTSTSDCCEGEDGGNRCADRDVVFRLYFTHVCLYVCMCVCMYARVCESVYACMYACMSVCAISI